MLAARILNQLANIAQVKILAKFIIKMKEWINMNLWELSQLKNR
jgi:hypothetical protein